MEKIVFILISTLFFFNLSAGGIDIGAGNDITHQMMIFITQIAVIIFAVRFFGILFKKIKLPSVLGELTAGIILGPYMLGSISLPGFPEGFFPLMEGSIPVSTPLYGIATLASIILLFLAGLETDIEMFFRYSVAGTVVGIGGIIVSFSMGAVAASFFMNIPFSDPSVYFLGIISTATSVGISARILSEHHKIESPEGAVILAGAVIDDVIGVILLAIAVGLSSIMTLGNGFNGIPWENIIVIIIKALGIWIGFTVLGIVFAKKISSFLKIFVTRESITVCSLGLAMIVASIFEQAGLAMIIGAYVVGLSLSKTDLNFIIQENMHSVKELMVPIFFAVMGMMVNPAVFTSDKVLFFGLIYTLASMISKFIGCGLPSLFLGFNHLGALRIGAGMMPRGEVTLIIAGIGLSTGILNADLFGAVVMMTLISTLIAPFILEASLQNNKKGTIKTPGSRDNVTTEFTFESHEIVQLLISNIRNYFISEGYFVSRMNIEGPVYHIKKDDVSIKMYHYPLSIKLITSREEEEFARTIVYEAFVKLSYVVDKVKQYARPEKMKANILARKKNSAKKHINLSEILSPSSIIMDMKSETKEDVIIELVDILAQNNQIDDKESVIKEVLEREKVVSTGMQNGFAFPHARTEGVDNVKIAVGIKESGINFDSMDGKPSHIFILIVSSKKANDPHIQVLAELSSLLTKENSLEKLISMEKPEEVWYFMTQN
ncbi:MAG: cation:proton antiporter [bacterium]